LKIIEWQGAKWKRKEVELSGNNRRSDSRCYLLILNNLQKSCGVDVTGDGEKRKSFEKKTREPSESDPDE
jgi:hypothetical protein